MEASQTASHPFLQNRGVFSCHTQQQRTRGGTAFSLRLTDTLERLNCSYDALSVTDHSAAKLLLKETQWEARGSEAACPSVFYKLGTQAAATVWGSPAPAPHGCEVRDIPLTLLPARHQPYK